MKLALADSIGRPEPEPLDKPSGVVGLAEREQGLAELLDGAESMHPEQVFLEGAYEALGAAVAFWRPDEGGRALGTEERQFGLEHVGPVLAPVIVTDGEAARDTLGEAAEVLAHALA